MITTDIAIIGAGIAGASLAARLAEAGRDVLLIEAESHPGYHATGRSAAFWSETYGGPLVQPLTAASLPFFEQPPAGFSDYPLVHSRGELHIADADGLGALEALRLAFAGSDVALEPLDRVGMLAMAPMLDARWQAALWEPGTRDIDVGALHQGFLRMSRQGGVRLIAAAPLRSACRDADHWQLVAGAETIAAGVVVNAAGAWADAVARLCGAAPLGIQPYRRTMLQLAVDPPVAPALPLVIDVRGNFYFKPEAGRLWLTPYDETPQAAADVAADELDVAIAIDRLEQATHWRQPRLERSWAGLRSFAPDRLPVYGFDPVCEGFFWCAGQGGFGIQTAPAASAMAAALLLGQAPSLDGSAFDPARFINQNGA